ncbi:hypothetical protein N0V90_004158 [Kalmusia sp. IMI 367209]|nr:hypothetical protein N0V90_004158 [Kalmusia sp. IMI 367209]
MENAITSQKWSFAAQILLILAIPMPKVSMCLSYVRIFYSDISGRHLIYGLLVLLVMTTVSIFTESFLTCQPLDLYWKELRPADKCLKDTATIYVHGSVNLVVDVALMCILIPRILNLQLNNRQRWGLVGIVMVGTLSVVAGVVRLVRVGTTLSKYYTTGQFDPSWDMYDVSIWTSTEIYVALICAAAPGVKPLVNKLLPKLLGTTLRSRTTGGHTNPVELSSKMKRTTRGTTHGTRHSTVLKSGSTANLTTAHGPYSEIHSLGKHTDEDSLDGKSDIGEGHIRERPADGIVRNTRVVITSEERV